tara:strand:+ start:12555 stop:12953 length:399 start_codon:yes stop_codon:yes gene_type:complete
MLTANQFHKQSGIQIEFGDFLQRMKNSFGENFMEQVNEGKVKLQEVQKALGIEVTTSREEKIADRKNVRVRKVAPKTKPSIPKAKSATGMKCSSCEASKKNASGNKKNNVVRNIVLLATIGGVVFWAMKNRK